MVYNRAMDSPNRLNVYLTDQLSTAKTQLNSIGPEADIEALHRFRVALRRFRSVLDAYTDHMYALDAVAKSMLNATNLLRETDVFLSSIDAEHFPNLYRSVEQYKTRQYSKIWKPKTRSRFDLTLETLIKDLSALKLDVSDKRLLKRADALHKKAKEKHGKLTEHSEETQIHHVRIAYKQVRYVLEFLQESGLLDAKKEVKKVKKVLDHFGAIQDAVNQLEWLHRFCAKHPSDECERLYKTRKAMLKKLKNGVTAPPTN